MTKVLKIEKSILTWMTALKKKVLVVVALALVGAAILGEAGNAYAEESNWICKTSWSGVYFYAPDVDRTAVKFTMTFDCSGGAITGKSEEPNINKLGNPEAIHLFAKLHGITVNGNKIRFTKTYDGTGGTVHSVYYSGEISADKQAVLGRWQKKGMDGKFSLTRN